MPRAVVDKRPFEFTEAFRRLRTITKPWPKAAMFQLADEGYTTLFHQLIACIISIRTFDETTVPTARRLFEVADTPKAIAALSVQQIDDLIRTCSFHEPKAKTIHTIAQRTQEEFGGELPCDFDALTSFSGVGPKCANLALGVACRKPVGIAVDIHVHRVTNRWGIVAEPTPERTMAALQEILPKRYWLEINARLVPFGKHHCTAARPKCSTCPLLTMCQQVGVTNPR